MAHWNKTFELSEKCLKTIANSIWFGIMLQSHLLRYIKILSLIQHWENVKFIGWLEDEKKFYKRFIDNRLISVYFLNKQKTFCTIVIIDPRMLIISTLRHITKRFIFLVQHTQKTIQCFTLHNLPQLNMKSLTRLFVYYISINKSMIC